MIGSRAVGLLKNFSKNSSSRKLLVQQVRNSSDSQWCYRTMPQPQKWAERSALALNCLAFWWFYWNLWHGWPHLIGLYDGKPLPDPKELSDEELGIPADDELIANTVRKQVEPKYPGLLAHPIHPF